MACDLIQQRTGDALGFSPSFNEVLSAAYMERQKMAVRFFLYKTRCCYTRLSLQFHSDSEQGLGEVVGSLSLGSPALMHFRPLSRFDERTKGGSRIVLTFLLRHVSATHTCDWLCTDSVPQGDIVIMQGKGVQTFYEYAVLQGSVWYIQFMILRRHTVIPMNVRIAATGMKHLRRNVVNSDCLESVQHV
jgi:hypothetical protein